MKNSGEGAPENNLEQLGIVFEKASIADLEAIQRLNQELCAKEHNEFDSTINPDYALSEPGVEYFKSRIESSDGCALIAKEGDEYVGYLIGGMAAPEDYRTIKSAAELENMYVKDSMRGKGIGGKLVQQFEDWCKEKGVEVIRVVASAENAAAIKFYEAHGAKPVSLTLEKKID
ncbi:MAG: GNAT family N-acetyltransferase [Patescibacteria group bacterium]